VSRALPQTVTGTVTRVFKRGTAADHVQIEQRYPDGQLRSTMSHWKTSHVAELRADFYVEIDVEKIVEALINRAKNSKSGKAVAMGGLITVRRRNVVQLRGEGKQNPIPEGWTEVQS